MSSIGSVCDGVMTNHISPCIFITKVSTDFNCCFFCYFGLQVFPFITASWLLLEVSAEIIIRPCPSRCIHDSDFHRRHSRSAFIDVYLLSWQFTRVHLVWSLIIALLKKSRKNYVTHFERQNRSENMSWAHTSSIQFSFPERNTVLTPQRLSICSSSVQSSYGRTSVLHRSHSLSKRTHQKLILLRLHHLQHFLDHMDKCVSLHDH